MHSMWDVCLVAGFRHKAALFLSSVGLVSDQITCLAKYILVTHFRADGISFLQAGNYGKAALKIMRVSLRTENRPQFPKFLNHKLIQASFY